jgi:hypothetical protein
MPYGCDWTCFGSHEPVTERSVPLGEAYEYHQRAAPQRLDARLTRDLRAQGAQ